MDRIVIKILVGLFLASGLWACAKKSSCGTTSKKEYKKKIKTLRKNPGFNMK